MSTRVFISHANGEGPQKDPADAFVAALSKRLRAEHFDVLVDVECLQPGSAWRQEIYGWLGLCHASIILYSERIFEENKKWVSRENQILMWRKAIDKTFVLIGVRFPGIDRARLEKNERFSELLLDERQYIQLCDDEITECNFTAPIQKIVKTLSDRISFAFKTPFENLTEQIAIRLKGIDEHYFVQAQETIMLNLAGWSHASRVRNLAQHLLTLSLDQLYNPLEVLLTYSIGKSNARANISAIKNILAVNWIAPEAARWIVTECQRMTAGSVPRPLVLNIPYDTRTHARRSALPGDNPRVPTHFELARMYVRRATCRPLEIEWTVIEPTNIMADGAIEALADEIAALLDLQIPVLDFDMSTERIRSEDWLRRHIVNIAKYDNRVVVLFRKELRDLCLGLQQKMPQLILIIIGGLLKLEDINWPENDFRLITPLIDKDIYVKTQLDLAALKSLFDAR